LVSSFYCIVCQSVTLFSDSCIRVVDPRIQYESISSESGSRLVTTKYRYEKRGYQQSGIAQVTLCRCGQVLNASVSTCVLVPTSILKQNLHHVESLFVVLDTKGYFHSVFNTVLPKTDFDNKKPTTPAWNA